MMHLTKNSNGQSKFHNEHSFKASYQNGLDLFIEHSQKEILLDLPSVQGMKGNTLYNVSSKVQSNGKEVSKRPGVTYRTKKSLRFLRGNNTKKREDAIPGSPESNKFLMYTIQRILEDPDRLVSGVHPTFVESHILRILKDTATAKAKLGLWEESYSVLKSVLRCEKDSLGENHPQVANTLYRIGIALDYIGDDNGALCALEEGIQILFPKRYHDKNIDLAALFYQCGVIVGKKGDYPKALYYLDLAKQVEIYVFGSVTEKTIKTIEDYEHVRKVSQLNQVRSRTA